ncbi:MAG: hypothetical protein DYG96_10480 [Chlorobi bacterium CHB2]|nr:hypothetical protein [Chlorobi bacterium CHB2]
MRQLRRWHLLFLSGLLCCFATTIRTQSQVRTIELREMVRSSETIFAGRVTEVRGALDERGDIVTYTTFSVENNVMKAGSMTITIKQFGGRWNGRTMLIPHARYFQKGERVMVMLYPVSDLGFTSPVGLSQAAWTISNGMVTGITAASLKQIPALLKKHGIAPPTTSTISMPIATFSALVRDIQKGGQ